MKFTCTMLAISLFVSSGCHVGGEAFDRSLAASGRPVKPTSVEGASPGELARSSAQRSGTDRPKNELSTRQTRAVRRSGGVRRLPKTTSSQVRFANYEQEKGVPAGDANGLAQEKLPALPQAIPTKAGLTLSEVEDIALGNNPTLAIARAKLDAARGKWLQVGLPPNPVIGYSGDEMGNEGISAGQQGGFVGQTFVTGGKLRLNRAVVDQEIVIAEQILATQQLRVLTDVRSAYYDLLVAQRRLDTTQELVTLTEQAVKASEDLLKAKEVSQSTLLQARVESDRMKILLRNAQNRQLAAWRRLSTVAGDLGARPKPLAGKLDERIPELVWDDALRRLLTESPELAVARALVERAGWVVDRAYAEVIPDLFVQVGVQQDNGTGDSFTGVQVGLPLPLFDSNQGGIRQAEAGLTAAERNVDRVRLNLESRLAVVFQDYSNALYQVDKYSKEILPNADKARQLVTKGYEGGELGFLTLLTAQRTYFQTRLSYIESLRELWTRATEIEGLLLKGSLQGINIARRPALP